ncbi:hypothetical protein Hypma_014732 [Hypsizygus marmoreus]|uniref:DUF6533 domain-containing protein n=1 Tax=Hypsizygus marmoreus TaxID=39966 RepID=A0A369JE68_HYPMA|nr:hypothetical protein Hypma_014732 [Hypsizygus marmoreus]
MDPTAPDIHALAVGAQHLLAGKYFQLAAYVVLIFDHILTFSEEVERIWKRRITGAAILFLINRYLTPLQFLVIIDAFHDPIWTRSVQVFTGSVLFSMLISMSFFCLDRFVAFEGASTVALIAVCELIMILRVFALYGRSFPILIFLMILWVVQVIISSVGLSTGFAVPLPPGLIGCIFTGSSPLFPSLWVAPLVTNSIMFFLTLYRTRDYILQTGHAPTLHIFVRDGTMYFLVILMANLMNTLIYFLAVGDLKAIGASFSQLITATMVSRLVLNLRSASALTDGATIDDSYQPKASIRFMTRTIGNLGEEVETYDDHDPRVIGEVIPMVDRIGKRHLLYR